MSSWAAKAKRDGVGLMALLLSVLLSSALLPHLKATSESYPSPGAKPFYWALQGLDQQIPWLPTAGGGSISTMGLALLMLASLGLFYAAWRITRNRLVSLAAAFLIAAHPLARAALAAPAGLGDIANMAALTWALAIAAAPRQRSSRFPTSPPRPMNRALLAVLVLGALSAPEVAWNAALVLVFDLFFQREANRRALERDWRAYRPHITLLALVTLLEVIPGFFGSSADAITLGYDHSERFVATFLPAASSSTWLTLLGAVFLVSALIIGVAELLFTLGRRRLTLPWIGFAAVAWLMTWFLEFRDELYTQHAWRGFVGLALLVSVIGWRLVMRLLPPRVIGSSPPASRPGWDEKLAHIGLQPLPDLVGLPPAPRLEDWVDDGRGMRLEWKSLESPEATMKRESPFGPELEAALEKIGRRSRALPRAFDTELAQDCLAPLLAADRAALLLLPSGSPYAAFVAERCGELILLEQVDAARPGFPELGGLDHVRAFEQDGRRPWPSRDSSIDLVLVAEVAENLPARVFQTVLNESRRILRPGGRMVLRYPVFERAADDSNALPPATLEEFIELAALRIVARREGVDAYILELARGDEA